MYISTTGPVCRDRGSKVRAGERDEYQSVRLLEINTQVSCAGPERVEIDRDFLCVAVIAEMQMSVLMSVMYSCTESS